jgi:hypothetical protein
MENVKEHLTNHSLFGNDRRQGTNKLYQLLLLLDGSLFILLARSEKFECYNEIRDYVGYFKGISGACLEMKAKITYRREAAHIPYVTSKRGREISSHSGRFILGEEPPDCIGGCVGPKAGLYGGVVERSGLSRSSNSYLVHLLPELSPDRFRKIKNTLTQFISRSGFE